MRLPVRPVVMICLTPVILLAPRLRQADELGFHLGLDELGYPVILLMSFVRARPESGVVEVVGNETWLNGPYAEVVAGVASYRA